MSFVRDKDASTRGVGAIASVDKVNGAGRARARAQARLMALRDQRLARIARTQPLSGYGFMGAAPVNPLMGHGRRPVLDRGGVVEGEGKSLPLGPRTGVTFTSPGGGGSGGTSIVMPVRAQPVVLDSKTSPLAPGKKPIKPTHPRPPSPAPTPTQPSPVVLLPVPNVSLPYPGSTGGGGGGGGSSSPAPEPLPEPDDAPMDLEPVVDEKPPMSTGKKVAIAAGIAGVLYLIYENTR